MTRLFSIGLVLTTLVATARGVNAVDEYSDSSSARVGVSVTAEVPAPPATPEPNDPAEVGIVLESIAPPEDSIHAVEINIDPLGGAHIVDRNGRRYYVPPDDLGGGRTPQAGWGSQVSHTDLVRFGSDVHIEEGETIDGNVTCIFGDVYVDGSVTRSVVAIFGHVHVEGNVGQDVIAPMGVVHVGPRARVQRQVVASRIEKAPGGRIVERPSVLINLFGLPMDQLWTRTTLTAILLLKLLFGLFLVLLAHVFAASNIQKVRRKLQLSFVKSLLLGIAAQILILPLVLLLFVTIVGIPIAVFILPLMILAAVVLSMAAAGLWIGDLIHENSGIQLHTQLGRTMMGQVIIWLPAMLAALLWASESWSGNGVFQISALLFAMLAAIVGYSVVTVGTGAVLLTRYGTRPKDGDVNKVAATRDPKVTVEQTPLPNRPHGRPDTGAEPVTG